MAFRHVSDQKFKCPICGKENTAHETFRCRRCARQYLCDDHLDPKERVCEECVSHKGKKDQLDEPGMVVVHDGEFFLGEDEDEFALDAQPQHPLRLERYLLDQYPVTNKEFKEFKPEYEYPEGEDDKPVTNVTWHEANDYATSKGKRLPSEPEWEKAARSRDKREYPWGRDLPTEALEGSDGDTLEALKKYNLSPYGVRDMVGGPWEWTSSKYEPYPEGPTAMHGYYEGNMAIRGGELPNKEPVKTYYRSYAHPSERRPDVTFRCCKGAKQEYEKKYAGSEIKRPKKDDQSKEPAPEFKAFGDYSKKRVDPTQHIDYSGLTVKEAVRQTQELSELANVYGEEKKAPTPSEPVGETESYAPSPEQAGGSVVPGKLGSDKRKKSGAAPPPVADDWEPPRERAGIPWGMIAIVVLVVAVVIVGFTMMRGAGTDESSEESAFEMPQKTTVESAPGYKQVESKFFTISEGNRLYPTNVVAQKGDRITITVRGWNLEEPPPLVAEIGDGPHIQVGSAKTFEAPEIGKIMLGYMGDPIVIPDGQDAFLVHLIIEIPDT